MLLRDYEVLELKGKSQDFIAYRELVTIPIVSDAGLLPGEIDADSFLYSSLPQFTQNLMPSVNCVPQLVQKWAVVVRFGF